MFDWQQPLQNKVRKSSASLLSQNLFPCKRVFYYKARMWVVTVTLHHTVYWKHVRSYLTTPTRNFSCHDHNSWTSANACWWVLAILSNHCGFSANVTGHRSFLTFTNHRCNPVGDVNHTSIKSLSCLWLWRRRNVWHERLTFIYKDPY